MQDKSVREIINKWNYMADWNLNSAKHSCLIAEKFAHKYLRKPELATEENWFVHYLLCRYAVLTAITSIKFSIHQILSAIDYLLFQRSAQDARITCSLFEPPASPPQIRTQPGKTRISADRPPPADEHVLAEQRTRYLLRVLEVDAINLIDLYDTSQRILTGKTLCRDCEAISRLELSARLADALRFGKWRDDGSSSANDPELADLAARLKQIGLPTDPSIKHPPSDELLAQLTHELASWVYQAVLDFRESELKPLFRHHFLSHENRFRFIHRLN